MNVTLNVTLGSYNWRLYHLGNVTLPPANVTLTPAYVTLRPPISPSSFTPNWQRG
jgi:hypothetical protein